MIDFVPEASYEQIAFDKEGNLWAINHGVNVKSVSAGGSHNCAVLSNQRVKCWGSNSFGQLGDGSKNLDVGFSKISAGYDHTCAITHERQVKCWGWDEYGQLGDGKFEELKDVTAISTYFHTCAVSNSKVYCWGIDNYGQLGDGSITDPSVKHPKPQLVGLPDPVTDVTSGERHSCALTKMGGVWCWGSNTSSQMGNGETDNTNVAHLPMPVKGLETGVEKISAGPFFTCAIFKKDGTVKCWGTINEIERDSNNNPIPKFMATPESVDIGSGVKAKEITVGGNHMCVLTNTDGVKCWGSNMSGQLGVNVTEMKFSLTPVDIVGLSHGVIAISAFGGHICALTSEGQVKCWGNNDFSQLELNKEMPGLREKSPNILYRFNAAHLEDNSKPDISMTLPTNNTHGISIDSLGFIWIADIDGIKKFKMPTTDSEPKPILTLNQQPKFIDAQATAFDKSGNLWVADSAGVYQYLFDDIKMLKNKVTLTPNKSIKVSGVARGLAFYPVPTNLPIYK
jgi:alpha-tubulin suppressor-like RCC1 family protein